MNKEFEITHRCGWDTFLFNLTEDPDERNNLVLDEKLFLFSNAEARTAFENEEPGIVQVADVSWAEMESERAQKKGCFSCF